MAARAGASDRCCALIAAHTCTAQDSDPLLAALITADHASIR
jgi:hypothetical protein